MVERIDDLTLNAYVDGELDAQAGAEIERALANDASLRARVLGLREVDAWLSGALKPALIEPNPPHAPVVSRPSANSRFYWPAVAASIAALSIGAVLGYQLRTPSTSDASVYERAFLQTLETKPSGVRVAWSNPDQAVRGTIVPVRTWQAKNGQYCREYQATKVRDNITDSETGVACRRDDGTWRVRMRYYD